MAKEKKDVQSIETKDGVTVITYEDGSTEVQHRGGVVQAGTISGGIHFG
ncbi:hypothetical protein KGD83_21770 [Nocardiopsis akebiae]|uniref:Uncharacterized protein n=1 Tax=Nocardiopsis akebiae TaxID=2831968 RepID=A0ABX8C454_9ACTN|nr:hypothetical protein [Nocardiopsis akebiae]QUX27883.1 hypothetical protein KGD83_21770 [Nocardiopsis akebiae]